jgi:hypothetical protein
MMELVERAIPVIQHPPETKAAVEPARRAATAVPQAPATTTASKPVQHDANSVENANRASATDNAVAHLYHSLERLRTQQAQLTSGAVLQQYQRQLSFDVEDSRPATKVLSVKG